MALESLRWIILFIGRFSNCKILLIKNRKNHFLQLLPVKYSQIYTKKFNWNKHFLSTQLIRKLKLIAPRKQITQTKDLFFQHRSVLLILLQYDIRNSMWNTITARHHNFNTIYFTYLGLVRLIHSKANTANLAISELGCFSLFLKPK